MEDTHLSRERYETQVCIVSNVILLFIPFEENMVYVYSMFFGPVPLYIKVSSIFLKIVALASAALDGFKNEAKKMVVALVDMERAFVPPQHFIRLVQRRYFYQPPPLFS